MKRIILLISLLILLFGSAYSQNKKVELIKKDLNNKTILNNNNNNTVVYPTVIKKPVGFAISQPLRDAPVISEIDTEPQDEFYLNMHRDREWYTTGSHVNTLVKDPVQQTEMGTVNNSKGIINNYAGQTSGSFPLDCSGDVGTTYFFQVVNTQYTIYNKSDGSIAAGPSNLNTIFDGGLPGAGCNDGDPIVLYDQIADRWLFVEFSLCGANDYMLIAVSTTNDPTGTWYSWSFDVDDVPDYMKLGVQEDGYYMGTNTSGKDDMYVFERSVMLAGGASPTMIGFNNPARPGTYDGFHAVLPLDTDGTSWAPAGTPGLFVTIADDGFASADELRIYELNADWGTPGNSTLAMTLTIPVAAFDSDFSSGSWNNIPQPGTTQKLDAVAEVLMHRAQYRNFSGTQKIVCTHTIDLNGDGSQGAMRWYELENTGTGWTKVQESTFAPDNVNRWMGSIAMNGIGQIALAYSVTEPGTNIYPGIRFVGQSTCAPSNTMDIAETIIQSGGTYQSTYNRWGDYSQMSVDPADDLTFWFTTQYMASSNTTKSTRVTEFTLDEACNPPSITTTNPTSLYKDRGKEITLTGSDFLGCTAVMGGITGTTVSNDGSTWVINFPAGDYSDGNLVVTNGAGSDNTAITINTRTTIPVDASTGANTDLHQTIDAAVDGLHAWFGTSNFNADYIIDVTTGTYAKSVTLNSELNPTAANTLTIQNSSGTSPVVNATGNNYGFNLSTVDYVQLKGFTVHDADNDNIYMQGNNCEISHNRVYNGGETGIKVETGSDNTITNNIVYSNSLYAIHINNSNNNIIKNNTVDDHGNNLPGGTVYLMDEDFDPAPSGWTRYTKSGSDGWSFYSSIGVGSTNAVAVNDPDVFEGWVSHTAITIPAGVTSIDIEYEHRTDWTSAYNTLWRLEKSTAPGNQDADWTTIQTWNGSATHPTSYTTVNESTTVTPGSDIYIGWYCENNNQDGIRVDNVKISYTSTPITDGAGLYVESGTGTTVENNIFVAKGGNNSYYALKTETGITVSSDYNTYYTTNTDLFDYNGTVGNTGPMQANDLNGDPLFVGGGDYHIFSTNDSYHNGEWPPLTASSGTWTTDGSDSPAIDAGNPADSYANEPANNGNCINQGAYGNTVQASKSGSGSAISWDGSADSNWQTTTNWSLGVVPSSSDDVTIPNDSPNYPVINNGIGTIAVCNNLTIENEASLTIDPDGYMTVSGNVTNNAGASGIVVKSNTSGDGSLIINNIAIDATVERYLSHTNGEAGQWHFIGSPVTAASVSLFNTNNFYEYDETQDDWWTGATYFFNGTSGWNIPAGNLNVGQAYIYYYYEHTLNYQGAINHNDAGYDLTVNYTEHSGNAANDDPYTNFDGWNLISNPHPCALDWESMDKTNDVTSTVYFYDDGISNYAYYTDGGASVNGGTQYIPSGQGFFAKSNDIVDGGVLAIPNSAKIHNDQDFWKTTKPIKNLLKLRMDFAGYSDETVVMFKENATIAFDDQFDAYKRFSWKDDVIQIYTFNPGINTDLAVNTVNGEDQVIIPLAYKVNTGDLFTIYSNEFNFDDYYVFLHDIEKNIYTEFSLGQTYSFNSEPGTFTDRFELIFEKSAVSVPQAFNTSVVLYPNPNTGLFYLTVGNKASDFNVEITNVTGQIVYKNTFENNLTTEINMNSQSSGVYFLKIKFSDNSDINKKIILK